MRLGCSPALPNTNGQKKYGSAIANPYFLSIPIIRKTYYGATSCDINAVTAEDF